ncbi:unnamed protein product [Mytilus edulis]|uniref:Death domain-containing protein n=1 Tax=Mytilus edulis TaxID=6550 RepID=A0A8S3RXV2_MYTED|nr:unnamed protein product [Mytilus edulis]
MYFVIKGATPLHKAAMQGSVEVTDILIRNNATVNVTDSNGATPLHKAAKQGSVEVTDILIRNNATINVTDRNVRATPLHKASKQGSVEVTDILIRNNATINVTDRNGKTPLHEAAMEGNIQLTELLIGNNADVNATDNVIGDDRYSSVFNYCLEKDVQLPWLVDGEDFQRMLSQGTFVSYENRLSLDMPMHSSVTRTSTNELANQTHTSIAKSDQQHTGSEAAGKYMSAVRNDIQTLELLNVSEDEELRIWVDDNRVNVYLTNQKSLLSISPDVAASIQECLTKNIESSLLFYHRSSGNKIKLTNVFELYTLAVGVPCGNDVCLIPVQEVNDNDFWKCDKGMIHDTRYLRYWIFNKETPRDDVLKVLSHRIGNCAMQLGIELGISFNEIERSFVKYPKDLFGLVEDILNTWKATSKVKTTHSLMMALQRANGRGVDYLYEMTK